jgi:hypothetical protein
MKTILLITLGFLLFPLACNRNEEKNESIEIPFTEYSLLETNCQWANFESDKVIIINSQLQLDLYNYITCTDGSYPKVDFSKNTLLLAKGMVAGGIGCLSKKIVNSVTKYVLEVEIKNSDTMIAGEVWFISIVSEKLRSKTNVELNIKIIKN